MKKIKLMVVDDNEEFINNVKESYIGDENVEIIATAKDAFICAGIPTVIKILASFSSRLRCDFLRACSISLSSS